MNTVNGCKEKDGENVYELMNKIAFLFIPQHAKKRECGDFLRIYLCQNKDSWFINLQVFWRISHPQCDRC